MASIRELATSCGVSPATVSRVLNKDPMLSVTTEVRERIIREAERTGYMTPRQRRMAEVLDISLALAPFDKPGFEERLVSKLQSLAGSGVNIHLYNRNIPTGAVIAVGEFSRDEVADFEKASNHLLMINNLGTSYAHDSIMMDYAQSEENVVRLFVEEGLDTVGYYGGTFMRGGVEIGAKRAEQFVKILSSYGLFDETCFKLAGMDEESGYRTIKEADRLPGGMIFSDPDFARGAFKALEERGADPISVTYTNFFAEDVAKGRRLLVFPDDIWRTAIQLIGEKMTGERVQSYCIYSPSLII